MKASERLRVHLFGLMERDDAMFEALIALVEAVEDGCDGCEFGGSCPDTCTVKPIHDALAALRNELARLNGLTHSEEDEVVRLRAAVMALAHRRNVLERVLDAFQLECVLPAQGPNDSDCASCDYDENQCDALRAAKEG